ncbi:lipopolysaccharide biosynthesis protein [Bacteroides sp. AN502(2024)]|uniref:lipopolysaccharide biosynthesis protein n=1 Tax=Bacteroides sp. AN502(2024) TaxID=3160599 RepID=UPI0035154E18
MSEDQSLKEKTAKGLFWGGFSNGIQQLLNLTFGIFLARLLSREDYGMIGMLSIFSLIAGSLQESGFTAALANRKNVQHKDYNAVFWFSSTMGFTLYVLLFFCAPYIAKFYDNPALTPLARYSFIGFFISSLGTAQSAYIFRNLMVKQRAISTMISLTISGIVGVTMVYCGMAYWGFATQNIVYASSITCCYWYFSPWRPTIHINLKPLKGMIAFSSRLLVTNIFSHINNNILSVILGKFYSEREVGDFNQANKWNSMGYSVITGMVNGIAQPILASVTDDRQRQKRIFRKMLRFTSFVTFPAMFGLSLITPELITIAVTSKWAASAEIMRILCIGSAFTAISSLYSNLIISKGKSDIYMWSTIALGSVQVAMMLYCSSYGISALVRYYICINISWLVIWQFFVWREIHLTVFQALKDISPFAIIAGGTMIATHYCTRDISNIYVLLIAKIAIAAAIYTAVMWMSGSVTFKESVHYLLKKR